MRNNNKAVVRRMAYRSLTANKKRNFFLIAAVGMTTLMVASVLSIWLSLNATMERDELRRMGTTAHVDIPEVSSSAAERIKGLAYIAEVGMTYPAGTISSPWDDSTLMLCYYDQVQWDRFLTPAYTDVTGTYPREENEIMLPRNILKLLGIENPELGMPLEIGETKFILSGWYQNYHRGFQIILPVSKEFLAKAGGGEAGTASILFKSNKLSDENRTRLSADLRNLGLSGTHMTGYTIYSSNSNPLNGAAAYALVILFMMLTGFLLIYNVLTISVSGDVRFYGLLKTVGTTPRQLRAIVVGQILRLCALAIPLGAGIAALLSLVIVPFALKNYNADAVTSFSPYIFIGAAVFALLTALAGAAFPARKAAGVSPIEATRYTGVTVNRKHTFVQGGMRPYRMAVRNLFRSKGRAAIAFLSLFLGLTTFLSIATIAGSLDADKAIVFLGEDDFTLRYTPRPTLTTGGIAQPVAQKFDDAYMKKLQALPGFESLWTVTKADARMEYTDAFDAFMEQAFTRMTFNNNMSDINMEQYKNLRKENFSAGIFGIASDIFQGKDVAYIASDQPEIFEGLTEVEFTLGEKAITLPVAGYVPDGYKGSTSGFSPAIFIPQTLFETYVDNPVIYFIGLQVSEENQPEVLQILRDMTSGDQDVYLRSLIEGRDEIRNGKVLFWTVGGSLSGILGLIGVLNFINVLTIGVMSRKRELAVLEAAGMTKRQLRRMLLLEGTGYAGITLALTASLGNLVALSAFRWISGEQDTESIFTYVYPMLPALLAGTAVLLICMVTPGIAYRSINSNSLSERLREAE